MIQNVVAKPVSSWHLLLIVKRRSALSLPPLSNNHPPKRWQSAEPRKSLPGWQGPNFWLGRFPNASQIPDAYKSGAGNSICWFGAMGAVIMIGHATPDFKSRIKTDAGKMA
jgi:hypothetical protein